MNLTEHLTRAALADARARVETAIAAALLAWPAPTVDVCNRAGATRDDFTHSFPLGVYLSAEVFEREPELARNLIATVPEADGDVARRIALGLLVRSTLRRRSLWDGRHDADVIAAINHGAAHPMTPAKLARLAKWVETLRFQSLEAA